MREINFVYSSICMNLKPFVFRELFVFLFHYNKAKLLSTFVFSYFNREVEKSNLGTREAQSKERWILLIISIRT